MKTYEYKVVPAPAKGRKGKKIKGPEGRFAFAVETVMNDMAAEGWEFQRTETLPSEERSGLTSSTTTFRSVMVFRRPRTDDTSAFAPRLLDTPAVAELPAPDAAAAVEAEAVSAPVAPAPEVAVDRSATNGVAMSAPLRPVLTQTPEDEEDAPVPAPLILTHAERKDVAVEDDPDVINTVSDISIALRARAKNVKQP